MKETSKLLELLKDKSQFMRLSLSDKEKQFKSLLELFDQQGLVLDISRHIDLLKKNEELEDENLIFYYTLLKTLTARA